MALLDKLSLERETAQLVAIDFDVSGDGIGASGEPLALFDRVDRGEPIHDRHALGERDRTSPQPDQAVRQVGGDVLRPPGQDGRRAQRHRVGRYFFFFLRAWALLIAAARALGIPFFFRPS